MNPDSLKFTKIPLLTQIGKNLKMLRATNFLKFNQPTFSGHLWNHWRCVTAYGTLCLLLWVRGGRGISNAIGYGGLNCDWLRRLYDCSVTRGPLVDWWAICVPGAERALLRVMTWHAFWYFNYEWHDRMGTEALVRQIRLKNCFLNEILKFNYA